MPAATSRQKILQHFRKNRTATAREVALALGMTSANARRHLSILTADGRLEETSLNQEGRGRPEKVYRISGKFIGDNLELLVRALLNDIPSRKREAALMRIGQADLVSYYEGKHKSLAQRLKSIIGHLNDMHYEARWEAGGAGPHVILGHCPYEGIITDYPELCKMDASMLENLLDKQVIQTAKLEGKSGGARICNFVVKES